MRVISIGYGRHFFAADNVERTRMQQCAAAVTSYDMVIFTNRSDNLSTQTTGNLTLHPTNSRNRIWMLFDALVIARNLIKANDEQTIVTTQDPFAAGFVGMVLRAFYAVHFVVQEHGDFYGHNHWRRESAINQVWYIVGLVVLKQADVVRVVSKRIKRHILQRVSHANVTVLPVSIDPQPFIASKQAVSTLPSAYFTYLTVARLVEQKNLELLLTAFYGAWLQNPNIRLQIVGEGPLQPKLLLIIASQYQNVTPPVTLTPWSDDVPSLMSNAHAYVLSSNYEGWARVLIEAMVVGLPVVTTDVGCVGEVLIDQQHGLVVPVGDQQLLQAALVRLAADDNLHHTIKHNLQGLSPVSLPGADRSTYGQQWVKSFGL